MQAVTRSYYRMPARALTAMIPLFLLLACVGGTSSSGSVTYTVSATAGAGGSISPASAIVDDGATASFRVTADSSRRIGTVSGCGGSLSGNTYTTGAITADCTVTASFIVVHTVTASAGTGGSISPAGATVDDGATTSFTVTADPGYLVSVSGCGGSLSGSTYTTGSITANCAVSAIFAQVSLNLTPQRTRIFHFTWPVVAGATEYRLLEDPDGASGYTEVDHVSSATSYDLEVSLPRRIDARYVLRACNGAQCVDSAAVSVSGTLASAVGYVKASNTGASDNFGWAVALSADGTTLAVGAYQESSTATGIDGNQSNDSAASSGAVYVFTRSGTTWSQQAYVKASNTQAYDYFGSVVALSGDGNTLAVGAPEEGSAATGVDGNQSDNSAGHSGAVYVFTRSGTTWSQQAYVKASNTEAFDHFGDAVTLSADGNTLAVGAYAESSSATGINGNQSDNSATSSGAVYVFTRSGTIWSQQTYVKASNTGTFDRFGSAVALSADGNTLAVGAPEEASAATGINGDQSDNSASVSGAVYVFIRSGSVWSQQAYVKASNTEGGDVFGGAVTLSADGNTLAVGAHQESSAATGIDGDQSDNSARWSGAVYVFTLSGAAWSQQAYVKASNTGAYDAFGGQVALSTDGSTLAVGAASEYSAAMGINSNQSDNSAGDSGAVYVFARSGTIWSQQAYVKASNTGANDWFGSVALSGDGNILAVGAPGESSAATGIDGNQADNSASSSGAIYLY